MRAPITLERAHLSGITCVRVLIALRAVRRSMSTNVTADLLDFSLIASMSAAASTVFSNCALTPVNNADAPLMSTICKHVWNTVNAVWTHETYSWLRPISKMKVHGITLRTRTNVNSRWNHASCTKVIFFYTLAHNTYGAAHHQTSHVSHHAE